MTILSAVMYNTKPFHKASTNSVANLASYALQSTYLSAAFMQVGFWSSSGDEGGDWRLGIALVLVNCAIAVGASLLNLKDHKKSVQNANVMHGLYDELSKWSAGSKKKFLVAWTSYELRARKEDFDTNLLYNALADLETKSAYDKVCSSHPDL